MLLRNTTDEPSVLIERRVCNHVSSKAALQVDERLSGVHPFLKLGLGGLLLLPLSLTPQVHERLSGLGDLNPLLKPNQMLETLLWKGTEGTYT